MSYRPTFRYLGGEGKRNRANADLYKELLLRAWGASCQVITGHHVSFLFDEKLETEDEVPSADCLLFDHEIMGEVFGKEDAIDIMVRLAKVQRGEREIIVRDELCKRWPGCVQDGPLGV